MKTLLFILLFSVFSLAATQRMVDSMTALDTYNHKPSSVLKMQREFRALSNIKKEEAREIARSLCHEKVKAQKLTHRKQLLFYRMYTKSCKIEINALDGAIISKILR